MILYFLIGVFILIACEQELSKILKENKDEDESILFPAFVVLCSIIIVVWPVVFSKKENRGAVRGSLLGMIVKGRGK